MSGASLPCSREGTTNCRIRKVGLEAKETLERDPQVFCLVICGYMASVSGHRAMECFPRAVMRV